MAKVKLNLEIDESIYKNIEEEYKKTLEVLKGNAPFKNIDEFLVSIITSRFSLKVNPQSLQDLMKKVSASSSFSLTDMQKNIDNLLKTIIDTEDAIDDKKTEAPKENKNLKS